MPLNKESFRKKLNDNYYSHKDLRPIKKTTDIEPKAERQNENMQTNGSTNVKMITSNQNPHQQFVKRKYPMNVTDFYSTLKNHDDNHNKL